MTVAVRISGADDLLRMSPEALERQANILLYGMPNVLEEACERQIFRRWIYTPRLLRDPVFYKRPRFVAPECVMRLYLCSDCGKPRGKLSSARCRSCYRIRARLNYFERRDGAAYWDEKLYGGFGEDGNHCGITLPDTEWFDDTDIPASPKKLATVSWNLPRSNFRSR